MTARRIGMVAHAGLGGSGTVALDLSLALARRGHEVHMITPRRPFRMDAAGGVRVHVVDAVDHAMWETPPWSLALAGQIAEVTKREDLELLHAHFAMPYAVAAEIAGHVLGAQAPPRVVTLHGSDVELLGRDRPYAIMTEHALSRARALTVPSDHLRARAQDVFAMARDIDVVPNFVDGARFRPSAKRPSPSAGEVVIIHASNFRAVKRIDDVVSIFARVCAKRPARLLLVGDGAERAPAQARLTALGLADRVEAPGAITDVETWLARAHVALVPSERESFGLSALEALASGVPVVGSAVGGLANVVTDGATGRLADVGDVDAMVAATLDIVSEDARWQTMAEAARTEALSRFSPERALSAFEAIYDRVLATS